MQVRVLSRVPFTMRGIDMIILITHQEQDPVTKKEYIAVSHGIDPDTMRSVCLQGESLHQYITSYGAVFLPHIGEYVLLDKGEYREQYEPAVTHEPAIRIIYR